MRVVSEWRVSQGAQVWLVTLALFGCGSTTTASDEPDVAEARDTSSGAGDTAVADLGQPGEDTEAEDVGQPGEDTAAEDVGQPGEDTASEDVGQPEDTGVDVGPVCDPTDCDDGDACTTDTCDEGSCIHTPVACNDQSACTADTCDAATGCVFAPTVCDDESACTTDTCDAATGCVFAPTVCDDESACTTDTCDAATGCVFAPAVCDDESACTTDTCDAATGCVYTPIVCDDGDACTTDACDAGSCTYLPVECDDGDPCTVVSCVPDTGACDAAPACDDGDACTVDTCEPETGECANIAVVCEGSTACVLQQCVEGACVGVPTLDCSDGNPCTADRCVELACAQGALVNGRCLQVVDLQVPQFAGVVPLAAELPAGLEGARVACQAVGADVAPLESAAENLAAAALLGACESALIGVTDVESEGVYVTIEGVTVPSLLPEGFYTEEQLYGSDQVVLTGDGTWRLDGSGEGPSSNCVVCASAPTAASEEATCAHTVAGACDDGELCTTDTCDLETGCRNTPAQTPAVIYFYTGFADDQQWSIDGEGWEIGPAEASGGQTVAGADPAQDASAGPDNGVAGIVIGGNVSGEPGQSWLISGPIDVAKAPGHVVLSFASWLNSDVSATHSVEVLAPDGGWVAVWSATEGSADAWQTVTVDLTAYKGPALRLRFGWTQVASESVTASWTLDEVLVTNLPNPVVLLHEPFADAETGWALDANWEIGPADAGEALPPQGSPDPSTDTSEGNNNGVAGVTIGGVPPLAENHEYLYLTSPAVNASAASQLTLHFDRWLNTDYEPYMQSVVQVWDGVSWRVVWQNFDEEVFDAAWMPQTFDISAYINDELRVRFGYRIHDAGEVYVVTSWNLDEVWLIAGVAPVCSATPCGACEAGGACSTAACDEATQFCQVGVLDCDDQNACTVDSCDPVAGCQHQAMDCATEDVCMVGTCNPIGGYCVYSGLCDDGLGCTDDSCSEGQCATTDACDDDNGCTLDSCSETLDCPGGTLVDGVCLVLSEGGTHAQARAACNSAGGDLASLNTPSLNNAATNALASAECSSGWIGGGDAAIEGEFRWYNGAPFDYTAWALGEPNDFNESEDTMELSADGQWNDQNVNTVIDCAVCQLPPTPAAACIHTPNCK